MSTSSKITVRASADLYLSGAQFQLMVDGKPVGAVQTVTASHTQKVWQDFTFTGDFGTTGPGKVEVVYLNDLWGGSSDKDRNLYVDKITVNDKIFESEKVGVYDRVSGTDMTGTERMSWAGKMVFNTTGALPATTSSTTTTTTATTTTSTSTLTTSAAAGSDTIVVRVSGDQYNGAPQFQLLVDGKQVGSTQAVTAVHGNGEWQEFTLKADLSATGSHKVEVVYTNDAWGGSSSQDRNLYVDKITVNGTVYQSEKVGFYDRVSGTDMTGTERMSYAGKMIFSVDGGSSTDTSKSISDTTARDGTSTTNSSDPTPTSTDPGSTTIAAPTQVIQLKAGCTQADIQAAINGAKDGALVVLPKDATIKISTGLHVDVSYKSVILDLNGSTLKQAGGVPVIEAHGSHPWTKSVSIATTGDETTIKFSTLPSDLKVGDWIKVISDDILPGAGQWNEPKDVRMGQAMQVRSISGNSVVLEGKLLDADHYDTNVRASKYQSGDLVIENGHIQGDQSQTTWKCPLVSVNSAITPVLDHLKVTDGNQIGINIVNSVNALVANADVRNLKDNVANANYGYGVHSGQSLGTTVVGLHGDKVRHATDDNSNNVAANSSNVGGYGADIAMNVHDSVAYNTTSAAWSWHSEANYGRYENVYAFDSLQFAVARGLYGTMVDSVGVNLSKGIQVFEYGIDDARSMTFDNVIMREVDKYAIFQSSAPQDNLMTDSTLEAYSAVGGGVTSTALKLTDTTLKLVSNDADLMNGTSGKDLLFGGAANDKIIGNGGNDVIWGGAGADTLTGGAGADRFLHNSTLEGGDVITDFTAGAGGDVLDLGILLTRIGYDGSNPVTEGYVRLLQSGSDTLLQVDSDGGANSFSTLAKLMNVKASSLTADNLDLTGVMPGQTHVGGAGTDWLVGGHYDDYFKGSGGSDTFVISGPASGHDTIMDFKPGVDRLEIARNLGGNGLTTASDVLAHAGHDVLGNLTLNLGNGNEVTLVGVTHAELTAQSIIMT